MLQMPELPPPHPDSVGEARIIDLRDRVARDFFEGQVSVTFPMTLQQSFTHFQLLRGQKDWKPFVARGVRDKDTGEVKPMDMGSVKRPFIVKMCRKEVKENQTGVDLQPLYPFTYLTFRKGKSSVDPKDWPERNWSFVELENTSKKEQEVIGRVFDPQMNHWITKLSRATLDLVAAANSNNKKNQKKPITSKNNKKSDGIGHHQDNGGIRKFRDMHPDTGFQDLILYPDESSYRWLQIYNPKTHKTFNLLPPSGCLITFTGRANRSLFHAVPKNTRLDLGERITIVARRMVTYYDWDTRTVYRNINAKKRKAPTPTQSESQKEREVEEREGEDERKGEERAKKRLKS